MEKTRHRYFILNKPYNIVSQFVSSDKVGLLSDLPFNFPLGTHAIGRLDNHSEGLLILTTNKKVTKLLFQGKYPHTRTYTILVQGNVLQQSLERLKTGIEFKITDGKWFKSTPCDVEIIDEPIFNFTSPYTQNKFVQYTWLKITLTEGKFHQVRKMTAAVGHKCVRLVRTEIEQIKLGNLKAGEIKEIDEISFFKALNIEDY